MRKIQRIKKIVVLLLCLTLFVGLVPVQQTYAASKNSVYVDLDLTVKKTMWYGKYEKFFPVVYITNSKGKRITNRYNSNGYATCTYEKRKGGYDYFEFDKTIKFTDSDFKKNKKYTVYVVMYGYNDQNNLIYKIGSKKFTFKKSGKTVSVKKTFTFKKSDYK